MTLKIAGGPLDPSSPEKNYDLSTLTGDTFLLNHPEDEVLSLKITAKSGSVYRLNFTVAGKDPLAPGKYLNLGPHLTDAPAWLVFEKDDPTLKEQYSPCPLRRSNLEILESKLHPEDYVERLHALFEYSCEPGKDLVMGELTINLPPPPTPLSIEARTETSAALDVKTGLLSVNGTIRCSKMTQVRGEGRVKQVINGQVVSKRAPLLVPCSQGLTHPIRLTIPYATEFLPKAARLELTLSAWDRETGKETSLDLEQKINIQISPS